ncbi:MAG: glycosyltransferase family 2 protein [Leptolyngbya sp. SIO4C1]|nr:glycosyltransferase family 2 protein [Leptolyngbya sp. SIO4C1]
MTQPPRVSIGFPVYNGETYLEEALDALLNQTFTDFELIISDNASSDRTEAICRDYASRDARIRYYRNAENLGAAPNYNRTFGLATGEYFKWAADDDRCEPTLLARCVDRLDQHPAAVLAYPRTVFTKPDGRKWWTAKVAPRLAAETPHQRFEAAIANFWCVEVFGLIRREQLAKTSLIASYYGSDKLLLAQLSLLGPLLLVDEPLFYRRCHANQSSRLSHEEREIWIDSQAAKRSKLWRPRNSVELFKSVLRLPLSWPERLRCLGVLWQKLLSNLPQTLAHRLQPRVPTKV